MSGADQLAGVPLPSSVREHALKHLATLERAEDARTVHRALKRAEVYAQRLEVIRALNPANLEALYTAFDNMARARLMELEQ
ncbi:MAG: hypothetical protein MUW57_10645 [Pseudomonas sp.]|nr:hypothetical protein [Pseudomonas sp.]